MASMRKQTHLRTLIAILILMVFVIINTLMQLVDTYSEWYAWTLYGVMVAAVFVVLRYQQRLAVIPSAAILAIPFVLVLLGALLKI